MLRVGVVMHKLAPSYLEAWRACLWSLTFSLSAIVTVGAQSQPDLAEGQEWSIKSASPTTAKIVIDRIEPWKNQTVVHISIIDIPASSSEPGTNPVTRIAHIPFEKTVLATSVDKLLATGISPPPNFEIGYKQWKENNGGIYTISVMQVLGTRLGPAN
jgi:hypothetical protein